ncbi:hypothetical protein TNCT_578311 [Trichonephila clavata]|uniref:Uncharacterized protein n=1 Tax=Trichonephila clavata TaxID=2740835 RepID=A0A8X6KQZ2_TRICU|nr:hypothetical protein TNCT_578311 [Trichonephila clavata]
MFQVVFSSGGGNLNLEVLGKYNLMGLWSDLNSGRESIVHGQLILVYYRGRTITLSSWGGGCEDISIVILDIIIKSVTSGVARRASPRCMLSLLQVWQYY